MSEYTNTFDDLRGDILGVLESMRDMHTAHSKLTDALAGEIDRLWKDTADLRDELHALANRVEGLTRARLTEPAETAARMVDGGQKVARGPFPHDDRLTMDDSHVWFDCECGVRVYMRDGFIRDHAGLHTCGVPA